MTPTEQDKELEQSLNKLSELNKLSGRGHGDLADTCYVCGISPSKLLAYITADRKRVELEARLDERNKIALDTYRGKTVSESTNWQAKFEYFMDSNERRIAELKAQQEET